MYTIHEVLTRLNREYSLIDYSSVTVQNLLLQYDEILVKLSPANSSVISQYSLKNFLNIYFTDNNVTLSTYFSNYQRTMPAAITPIKDITNPKKVTHNSIWKFGLHADRGIFNNLVLSPNNSYLPDIIISKPDSYPNDLLSLQNKILYLVNGIIFFEQIHDGKAYLIGASEVLEKFDSQQISIIDFSSIGGFSKVIIDSSNATMSHSSGTDATIVVSSPINLDGLTPLVVINGKLHILDNTYTVIENNKIAIKLKYTDVIADLVKLDNDENITFASKTSNVSGGFSMESINTLGYIGSGNSAILLLPTNELSMHKQYLLPTGFTGRYAASDLPTGILQLEDGTIGDYNITELTWYGNEISTTKPKLINALKDTIPFNKVTGINTASLTFDDTTSRAIIIDLYTL